MLDITNELDQDIIITADDLHQITLEDVFKLIYLTNNKGCIVHFAKTSDLLSDKIFMCFNRSILFLDQVYDNINEIALLYDAVHGYTICGNNFYPPTTDDGCYICSCKYCIAKPNQWIESVIVNTDDELEEPELEEIVGLSGELDISLCDMVRSYDFRSISDPIENNTSREMGHIGVIVDEHVYNYDEAFISNINEIIYTYQPSVRFVYLVLSLLHNHLAYKYIEDEDIGIESMFRRIEIKSARAI